MPTDAELFAAVTAEFQRLGLRLEMCPGDGLAVSDQEAFLEWLRSLEPPVSWQDVFPGMPAHWVEGRPETWTSRYRPLGPYDHQSLPTGPAVHVHWPRTTDPSCLDRLVADARAAGWAIHGAGFIEVTNPEWTTHDAMIILERGTTGNTLDEFLEWIDTRSDVDLAAVPRLGTEEYFLGDA